MPPGAGHTGLKQTGALQQPLGEGHKNTFATDRWKKLGCLMQRRGCYWCFFLPISGDSENQGLTPIGVGILLLRRFGGLAFCGDGENFGAIGLRPEFCVLVQNQYWL
jgi:hypothetical protein